MKKITIYYSVGLRCGEISMSETTVVRKSASGR